MSRHTVVLALAVALLILALTVFEQDRTIAAQKDLIHKLWADSAELTAMKIAQVQDHRAR